MKEVNSFGLQLILQVKEKIGYLYCMFKLIKIDQVGYVLSYVFFCGEKKRKE